MVYFPPVKLNLGLQVLSRRDDGYHNIESCFFEVPFGDILEVLPTATFKFTCSGLKIPGTVNDNLCVKAYALLQDEFKLPPVAIHLHKLAPMGAGLGGGSADAAYVLKALNTQFHLNCTADQLEQYAAKLGSDCPFFIRGGAQLAEGTGTMLKAIDFSLSGYYMVIVSPEVHVSTKEAYAGMQPRSDRQSITSILELPIDEWKHRLENDFEVSVFERHPKIKGLKESLYEQGALYASMTGSGSAVYGVFKDEVSIKTDSTITWKGILP